jgi:hypothetical protein
LAWDTCKSKRHWNILILVVYCQMWINIQTVTRDSTA